MAPPSAGSGLQVWLADAAGVPWPTEAVSRRHGDWVEAYLRPLQALPPGQSFHVLAEAEAAGGTETWRETVAPEASADGRSSAPGTR